MRGVQNSYRHILSDFLTRGIVQKNIRRLVLCYPTVFYRAVDEPGSLISLSHTADRQSPARRLCRQGCHVVHAVNVFQVNHILHSLIFAHNIFISAPTFLRFVLT